MDDMGRVLITGDTHGNADFGFSKFSSKKFPEGRHLTKDDYMIILGDFGLPWRIDKFGNPCDEEKYLMKWLHEKKWTTLFIDGNHENFDYLDSLPIEEKFGGKVQRINDSIFRLCRGEIFEIHNKKIFVFGGGQSVDKDRRIQGVSWWPQEIPSHQEMEYAYFNLEKHNFQVDYILTHVAPLALMRTILETGAYYDPYHEAKTIDPVSKFLDMISVEHIEGFKHHYFGHYHIDRRIEYKFTALYRNIIELI